MGIRSGRLHDAVTQGILDAEVATLESAIDDIVNAGASGVTIADAGEYYDGENAETVLQEVGAQLSAIDTSNVGKVYDTNGEAYVSVWIGAETTYSAIDPIDENTLYLVYADPPS